MGFMTSSLGSDWYRENQWALPRIFRCSALAPRAAAAAGPGGGAAAAGAGAGGRARGRGGAAGQVREDAAAVTGTQVTRTPLCQVVCSNAVSHQAPQQTCPPGPQDQQCSESTAMVWRRRSSDIHSLIFYVLLLLLLHLRLKPLSSTIQWQIQNIAKLKSGDWTAVDLFDRE